MKNIFGQAAIQTVPQEGRALNRQTGKQTDTWKDGEMDRSVDEQMDVRTDR